MKFHYEPILTAAVDDSSVEYWARLFENADNVLEFSIQDFTVDDRISTDFPFWKLVDTVNDEGKGGGIS